MNRCLLEECPICTDMMKCMVVIGNLGTLEANDEPVNEVYMQWGTGNPDPPPEAITKDFTVDCPWCAQELAAKVIIPYLVCLDEGVLDIQLHVVPEEEEVDFRCSNCSKDSTQLHGSSGLCLECYSARHEAITQRDAY